MNFEWDESKADSNLSKHSITCDDATTVFGDPLAITFADPDHSIEEERFLTFGRTSDGKFLVVSHSDRNDRIRLISAREMTRTERSDYEQN